MDSLEPRKKEWVLTQDAFDQLLSVLDADREQAGRKYEQLRLKIVKYFEWRGVPDPDGEADETINRVARRIEEGADVYNLNAYFYGVARLVFAEWLREREREQALGRESPAVEPIDEAEADAEERRECLDHCLQCLPDESRELIVEYYQGEGGKKIERRRGLASRLGIGLNALRIRAHRIRLALEACVRECLKRRARETDSVFSHEYMREAGEFSVGE